MQNLSPYLCKDVENLDDLGCPKASKLLENQDAEWNCCNYPYRHKKTLHCAEKKTYAYGKWTLNFLIIFNVCIRDCFLSFSFVIFFSEISFRE